MKQLSNSEIKEFLENSSLYVWREFEMPEVKPRNLEIGEMDAFCEKCGQLRPFQDLRSKGSGINSPDQYLRSGTSYFQFRCVSCKIFKREYHVQQIVNEETTRLQKYGELPKSNLREILVYNCS